MEIARNPEARIRDIAAAAGITERTVQAIVADLEAAGYITRTRTGRRTRYTVNPDSLFRHSAQDGHRVGPFLALLTATGNDPARSGNVYPARSGLRSRALARLTRMFPWAGAPGRALKGRAGPRG